MQHPGIAQIFEAGTAEGQPYFAMELICGRSITDFARQRGLGVAGRMLLLANVCDAVQHAHGKGVIHRDLKPANILVDAAGAPKVLDFGVARAMDADDATFATTRTGQIIGTPRYMAPEQLLGDANRVDARCDVYALGAVAFELLAGRPPLELDGLGLSAAVERARSEEPPRLGTLMHRLRGDVETIIATALAKEPDRRYASVGQLAEDIRRFLRDEPIFARPATLTYQLRKFARRRRGLVTAAATVFVVALVGGAVSTWALVKSMRANAALVEEQKRTLDEAQKSRLAFDFMRHTFTSVDPDRDGKDVRLLDALNASVSAIGPTFEGRPDIESHVRLTFGMIYRALGQYREAREQLERADALAVEADMPRLGIIKELAEALQDAGDGQALLATAEQLLTLAGDDYPAHRASALGFKGKAHQLLGDAEAAERWLREAIATESSAPTSLAATYGNLAMVLQAAARFDEAGWAYEQSIELLEQHRGPEDDDTLRAKRSYADFLALRGQHEQAAGLLEAVLDARQRRYGRDHPATLGVMHTLGGIYSFWMGRTDEGDALLKEAQTGFEQIDGPEHPRAMSARADLAASYFRQERYEDAEPLFRRVLEYQRESLGDSHPKVLRTTNNLAQTLQRLGRSAEADVVYVDLVPAADAAFPTGHWEPAVYRIGWANALIDLGRHDQAEPLLAKAQTDLLAKFGPNHFYSKRAAETLARLAQARAAATP